MRGLGSDPGAFCFYANLVIPEFAAGKYPGPRAKRRDAVSRCEAAPGMTSYVRRYSMRARMVPDMARISRTMSSASGTWPSASSTT